MPVRRDVLIKWVSAGKSVGEIAWRKCDGIGSRGHVVGWLEGRSLDTSTSVRGQKEKMGVWPVDVVGWRSCVWRWKLTTDCSSFVCEKSGKVISCYRSGGRWWRRTEEIIKCSEEIMHVWRTVDLVVEMWGFGSVDFSGEERKQRLIPTQVRRIVRAGLEERGQMSSGQEVKVEHKVSVAAFTSRDDKWVNEGREDDTTEERLEGEREHRFHLKVTGKGVGGTRVAKCNVNLMKKWSEICSGWTKMLSAVQSHV